MQIKGRYGWLNETCVSVLMDVHKLENVVVVGNDILKAWKLCLHKDGKYLREKFPGKLQTNQQLEINIYIWIQSTQNILIETVKGNSIPKLSPRIREEMFESIEIRCIERYLYPC